MGGWGRTWRSVGWRGLVLVLVYGCGLTALIAGVEVSAHAGEPDPGILAKFYYSLGLFVLGGLDLGVPSGGPDWARALLWAAYFAAPAVTASAVVEGATYLLRPERWRLPRLRGHVVVSGGGRTAALYLERLRRKRPGAAVVLVAPDGSPPTPGVDALQLDLGDDHVLRRLRLEHADRVLLMADDDWENLEHAARIVALVPALAPRVVAHVADLRLKRILARTAVRHPFELFNAHQLAASRLVEQHLVVHFRRSEARDFVVLAGFGRFGQSVLEELQRTAAGCFDTVALVDVDAARSAAVFDSEVGFAPGIAVHVLDGNLRDPSLWARLDDEHRLRERAAVIVIASDDDALNLRTATRVAADHRGAHAIAIRFRRSSFVDELAAEAGFRVFATADLVRECMPDPWFDGR
jgi:voltage-gated potassium channel Kch